LLRAKNTPNTRQIFIATHSEDFLKGLLDADNENVKIVRIDRVENINHIHLLKSEDIKKFWKDPILRYSNILSGLFHSKVVLCESDSDCRFYQSIMNAIYDGEHDISPDILFTHCGGKQRLKTVISALRAINVKTIVICDIDALNDKDIFIDISRSLGINWSIIESDWNIIDTYVKSQRPQLNKDEVINEINTIIKSIDPSETILPQKIAEGISKVIKKSSAWSKIKETGYRYFTGEAYNSFEKINNECHKNGLFIVSVGELESFNKAVFAHGPRWVNEVLETCNLKKDDSLKEARDFVACFLKC
jgi:hypothetical protein